MMLVHIVTCIGRKANGFAIDSAGVTATMGAPMSYSLCRVQLSNGATGMRDQSKAEAE